MTTQTISFRISTETYLKLEATAASYGSSVGTYLRKKLEGEQGTLEQSIQSIQIDIKEILNNISSIDGNSNSYSNADNYEQNALLLETILILREIAQPTKVANAQKKLKSIGLNPFNILEQ